MSNPPFGTAIPHDAGHVFNYALWEANSRVSLHNVRWNSDYRDIVYFPTQQELDDYLASVVGPEFQPASYCKANEPIRVNLPFNACYMYNYLRVANPAQPISGDSPRVFYYFIKDVQYLSPESTQLVLQLDVWQTFSRYIQFGNCFIERGHIGIANEDAFEDHGREYLTVPEGFDMGNEYVTSYALEYTLANKTNYNVLVASTTYLNGDPGSVDDPQLKTASGSKFEGLPNGMGLYLFDGVDKFTSAMAYLSNYPWVSQGIVSIMIVPDVYDQIKANQSNVTIGSVACLWLANAHEVPGINIDIPDFRENLPLPERYAHLLKFRTYPYSVLEMTTYHGTPLLLKPECVATDVLRTRVAMHLAPPSPRILVYPLKYNGKKYANDVAAFDDMKNSEGTALLNDRSEFLDMTTGIFDLPMFSIVNNSYLNYMASNVNRIGYAYQSADWSQQRAMAAVQLGYNQSSVGANNAFEANMNNIQAMISAANLSGNMSRANAGVSAIGQVAGGGISGIQGGPGALGQGMLSGMTGLAHGELDYARALGMAGIQNSQMLSNAVLARETAMYNRDTNAAYGAFAAHGDYANEIAGINARVQDAKLIQPTTSGQLGGEASLIANFKWGVFTKFKTLQPAVMATIGEFWLRYGYAINRFGKMPADFKVMSKFTYWKLRETYITSASCPETFKQAIRGIFEKGVTVWTNPNDMGSIDLATNEPLEGVKL